MAKIIYNGISIDARWRPIMEESQKLPYYTSKGIKYPRIRYGDEDPRWGESPCRNCGVVKGQYHVIAECEHEKCPKCGQSIGGHTCSFDEFGEEEAPQPSPNEASPQTNESCQGSSGRA